MPNTVMLQALCARSDQNLQHPEEVGAIISPLLPRKPEYRESKEIAQGHGTKLVRSELEFKGSQSDPRIRPFTRSSGHTWCYTFCSHSTTYHGMDVKMPELQMRKQKHRCEVTCPKAIQLREGAHLSSSPVSQGFGTLLKGNNSSSSLCTSGSLGGDSI